MRHMRYYDNNDIEYLFEQETDEKKPQRWVCDTFLHWTLMLDVANLFGIPVNITRQKSTVVPAAFANNLIKKIKSFDFCTCVLCAHIK